MRGKEIDNIKRKSVFEEFIAHKYMYKYITRQKIAKSHERNLDA